MKRRVFLQNLSMATATLMLPIQCTLEQKDKWGKLLPLRKLGNTGERVTMLGLGGFHVGDTSMKEAEALIEMTMAQGIRFIDTAYSYGQGESERRFGKLLIPKYRDEVFLMTKSGAPDYKTARKELEESLRRLNTDVIDLWQVHSIESPVDVDSRIKNGVLRLAEDALKEGKIRYAGFTGHSNPYAFLRMMEQAGNRGLFSAIQCPVNPIDAQDDHSFIKQVIPKAIENNLGVLAMKTLAAGRVLGAQFWAKKQNWSSDDPLVPNYLRLEEVFQFVWSLPVSTLITGAETAVQLQEKIDFAKRMVALKEEQRGLIIDKLIQAPGLDDIEYYKKV